MFKARIALPLLAAAALVGGAAGTTAATRPSLTVTPNMVHRGENVTFSGAHWAKRVRVTLLLARPQSDGAKFAVVTTNRRGRFRYTLPIKPTSPTGDYVIWACRKNCAVKVTRKMTILE